MNAMTQQRRLAIILCFSGGMMSAVSSLANRIGTMNDFWEGFILGVAVGLILWGVYLAFKDQANQRKAEKEKEEM